MPGVVRATFGACALLVVTVHQAGAQENPGPVAEVSGGWVGFADDSLVSEGFVGGNARFYLSPRLAVGPEVVHIVGQNHSHLVATGNLTYDIRAPSGAKPRQVTPFLVAGGGLFQTRQSFPTGRFTSGEGAFTAGGGVRIANGNRTTVGVDARIGWELHLRVNGFVGVRLW